MVRRIPVVLVVGTLCIAAQGDELDEPPAIDEDPYCLARKAALEAHLRSIVDVPVSKGKPCPPDPEKIRHRELICQTEDQNSRIWALVSDGFEPGSSMLDKGVSYVVETLGPPLRVEEDDGFWDIDVYEIPRTLYFQNVTVKTRDFVGDAVNFDLATGTVSPTNAIYDMLIDGGKFRFAHGLALGSTREEVEAAVGLPCRAVAYEGRIAVRDAERYRYSDASDPERSRYSVTFSFDEDGRVASIRWYYDSAWH